MATASLLWDAGGWQPSSCRELCGIGWQRETPKVPPHMKHWGRRTVLQLLPREGTSLGEDRDATIGHHVGGLDCICQAAEDTGWVPSPARIPDAIGGAERERWKLETPASFPAAGDYSSAPGGFLE